ncbi:MAG: TOBE domain-containing protein, partial [Pseudomonadota bacterium]
NLVDGTITGSTFRADGFEIPGLSAPDGAVTLGFRAEDASIANGTGQLTEKVYSMELLGDATMVTVRAAGAQLSVKAAKDYRTEIGNTVSFNITADICHVFDGTTGERVAG